MSPSPVPDFMQLSRQEVAALILLGRRDLPKHARAGARACAEIVDHALTRLLPGSSRRHRMLVAEVLAEQLGDPDSSYGRIRLRAYYAVLDEQGASDTKDSGEESEGQGEKRPALGKRYNTASGICRAET